MNLFNKKSKSEDKASKLQAAHEKVESWLLVFDLDLVVSDNFLKAVAKDRLSFDPETKEFSFVLKEPILAENQKISIITLRPLVARDMVPALKQKAGEFENGLRLLSQSAGVSYTMIERIPMPEVTILLEILSFFVG